MKPWRVDHGWPSARSSSAAARGPLGWTASASVRSQSTRTAADRPSACRVAAISSRSPTLLAGSSSLRIDPAMSSPNTTPPTAASSAAAPTGSMLGSPAWPRLVSARSNNSASSTGRRSRSCTASALASLYASGPRLSAFSRPFRETSARPCTGRGADDVIPLVAGRPAPGMRAGSTIHRSGSRCPMSGSRSGLSSSESRRARSATARSRPTPRAATRIPMDAGRSCGMAAQTASNTDRSLSWAMTSSRNSPAHGSSTSVPVRSSPVRG